MTHPTLPRPLTELLSFLDGLPEPRIAMDADYRIIAANPAYVREFGDGRVIRGRACYEVSHRFTIPCDQAGESCPLKQSLESGLPQRVLHLHHTPRGEEHVDVETLPVRDDDGKVAYFVETMRRVRHASSRAAAQGLVGRAPEFLRLLEQVLRVAPADSAVLILGETGTGKELVARAVHEASPRSAGAFVAVDCAGLSEALFESELFGHEKGAFTGASHRKLGLVEAASGGTLFLDEIGDLPLTLQVKLLRLLETATYRRVGGLDTLPADFRLLAATHRDLKAMVNEGSFRRDLYYRLNVFPIRTPALHQRAADIPLLATSLLERVDRRPGRRFSPDALEWLAARRFEGNIRELRNLIERAALMADQEILSADDLRAVDEEEGGNDSHPALGHASQIQYPCASPEAFPARNPGQGGAGEQPSLASFRLDDIISLDHLAQRYMQWVTGREKDPARLAERLGISIRTLYRKMKTAPR